MVEVYIVGVVSGDISATSEYKAEDLIRDYFRETFKLELDKVECKKLGIGNLYECIGYVAYSREEELP